MPAKNCLGGKSKVFPNKVPTLLLVVLVGILELPGGVGIRVVHRLLLVRVVDEIVLLCGGLCGALKWNMAKNLLIYRDWYRPLPVYWQAGWPDRSQKMSRIRNTVPPGHN
jgi:hypothetical protein